MCKIITPEEFKVELCKKLEPLKGKVRSVTGPGRSGAVASVYASYYLKIPWLPQAKFEVPAELQPLLVVDMAIRTGHNLRRCGKLFTGEQILLWVFKEPPNVKFWYEKLL